MYRWVIDLFIGDLWISSSCLQSTEYNRTDNFIFVLEGKRIRFGSKLKWKFSSWLHSLEFEKIFIYNDKRLLLERLWYFLVCRWSYSCVLYTMKFFIVLNIVENLKSRNLGDCSQLRIDIFFTIPRIDFYSIVYYCFVVHINILDYHVPYVIYKIFLTTVDGS